VLAVHDGGRYLPAAVESVLRQTIPDLELVVVDDGSTDQSPAVLAAVADPRLVVVVNDEQLGLAASLNRGFEASRGRYAARLDADDVALPDWLELLLAHVRARPDLAVVGTAMLDIDAAGTPGALHRLPRGPLPIRWSALFGSPFFHSTVLLDRGLLDLHGLRYDPSFLESEDYDLWARLLAVAEGDNVARPLVLRRRHAGQAQERRGALQRAFQQQVALREIARVAPDLAVGDADLAWRLGSGGGVPDGAERHARAAYLALLERFEARHGRDAEVRGAAARALARHGGLADALRLAPALPVDVAAGRARRRRATALAQRRASAWLAELEGRPLHVTVVSPEPTPYRAPLFDRVAARPEVDLTVVYAARTLAGRNWSVEPRHRSVFLRGVAVPGLDRVVHHDYPLTPGVVRALRESRPDVVVVAGWSTFAAQAAIAWCRARAVAYVLLVESHDLGPRPGWRRAVKGAVVPRLVRGAAGALVVGTAARESLVARGAPPERVRVFANTVDVDAWTERARALGRDRRELRDSFGLRDDDVAVLFVGRLAPEKGLDTLVEAVAAAADPRLVLLLAGDGSGGDAVADLARSRDVRLVRPGELPEDLLAGAYVAADVFALLSSRETWGVVVNEAAASGLPLVLSDRVGAAHDLLEDGANGALVQAGDAAAAATALRTLAADAEARRRAGARSQELVRGWGYEPSVESFVAAVREAATR
jgi:glycosyltransferase involved in cell wall biosynthesis